MTSQQTCSDLRQQLNCPQGYAPICDGETIIKSGCFRIGMAPSRDIEYDDKGKPLPPKPSVYVYGENAYCTGDTAMGDAYESWKSGPIDKGGCTDMRWRLNGYNPEIQKKTYTCTTNFIHKDAPAVWCRSDMVGKPNSDCMYQAANFVTDTEDGSHPVPYCDENSKIVG